MGFFAWAKVDGARGNIWGRKIPFVMERRVLSLWLTKMKGQLNLGKMLNWNFNSFFQYFFIVCKMNPSRSQAFPQTGQLEHDPVMEPNHRTPCQGRDLQTRRVTESQNGFRLDRTIILKNTETFSQSYHHFWMIHGYLVFNYKLKDREILNLLFPMWLFPSMSWKREKNTYLPPSSLHNFFKLMWIFVFY